MSSENLSSKDGTNLFIHIARVRELAEGGFYHLQAGVIKNPVTGRNYPIYRSVQAAREAREQSER